LVAFGAFMAGGTVGALVMAVVNAGRSDLDEHHLSALRPGPPVPNPLPEQKSTEIDGSRLLRVDDA
jgi:hypothetical protein